MKAEEEIYIALLNEGVDAWRPVVAEKLSDNLYRIIEQPYDRGIEEWEFIPGDVVECEFVEMSDGRVLAARRKQ